MKIAVLVSGSGSNLQALIDNVESGEINGEIVVVISDKKDAYALERAKNHGIKSLFIDKKEYASREAFHDKFIDILKEADVQLVVLAGFLSILGANFVKAFEGRIINIHPSLIPSFCGAGLYGQKVHKAAIEYGVKVSGATVHFVDEGTDTGKIILQEAVQVMEDDTPETLGARVLEVEHRILSEAVRIWITNN